MVTYFIGDAHGCYDELIALLHEVGFTPGKDTLWLTGDLAARGLDSLGALRYVKPLGDSVCLVLGNHDLHLLAVFTGISCSKPKGRLISLLGTPNADELLSWLCRQPLLQIDKERKLVTVRTGIAPQWDLWTAEECACDVEAVLSSGPYPFFLDTMYGDMPNNQSSGLWGPGKLRFVANAFTRVRFCFPNGRLDMYSRESPEEVPVPLKPRFMTPDSVAEEYNTAFGHWVSPEGKDTPEGIYALDTGYCWGGTLARLRWEGKWYFIQPSNRRKDLSKGKVTAP